MTLSELRTILLCGAMVLLFACASAPETPLAYKLYPGPVRPATDLAIVQLGDVQYAIFDGRATSLADWTEVHLLPGRHNVELQAVFGVSVMIEPSGFGTGGIRVDAVLEAGHIYVLRADRTTGPGYRMYLWIEDRATGQVVAGERKP